MPAIFGFICTTNPVTLVLGGVIVGAGLIMVNNGKIKVEKKENKNESYQKGDGPF